jgi:NADH-quinone oxidoreductase subunit M
MTAYLLSIILLVPLLAGLMLLFIPARLHRAGHWLALGATFVQLLVASLVWINFDAGSQLAGTGSAAPSLSNFQFVEQANWFSLNLGSLGHMQVQYLLGVDGLSVPMVWLAALVMLVGVVSSWNIQKNTKGYFLLYLLLSSSVVGCFVALDFFLFYLFFEFMLLPMYFLIGMWGGPRREYASIKFFLYTLLGSLFILVVMIGLYVSAIDPVATGIAAGLLEPGIYTATDISRVQVLMSHGELAAHQLVHTFNFIYMMDVNNFIPGSVLSLSGGALVWGQSARLLAFLALFIGFAVKLPAVPLHTWLPDAHVEAPTPISVVLAGILLKIGAYGLIRIAYPVFPEGAIAYAFLVAAIGVLSIIYGALNALAQHDLKKMIAYSSVSHMGYVLLGLAALTPEGVSGALFQMFSHGLIAPLLFLLAGVLYDRTHDRLIENYSGLAAKMPAFTAMVVIAFFASLGLPGFSGFIAEMLVFLGSFKGASHLGLFPHWLVVLGVLGLLLGAAYYLWTLQRMFFGNYFIRNKDWEPHMKDLTRREYLLMIPLVVAIILFGIMPHLFLDVVNHSVSEFTRQVYQVGRANLQMLLY